MLCISEGPTNDCKSMKICPEGFNVGQINPQGILICNKLERFIYVNNTNCFKCSICGYCLRRCGYVLLLLGKSIGISKYTILAFKFVKKSGSEIHDHKNALHRPCNLL